MWFDCGMTKLILHVEALFIAFSTNHIDYIHLAYTIKRSLFTILVGSLTQYFCFQYNTELRSICFVSWWNISSACDFTKVCAFTHKKSGQQFLSNIIFWHKFRFCAHFPEKKNFRGENKFVFKTCYNKNCFYRWSFPMAASFVLRRQWAIGVCEQCVAQTQAHDFYHSLCWLKRKRCFARTAIQLFEKWFWN